MINESHFLKNARAIRSALDLDWKDYIYQFGMTQKDAAKHLLNPENFPVSYAMNFCEFYELDIETAFSDQFDVKAFARNYLKEIYGINNIYSSPLIFYKEGVASGFSNLFKLQHSITKIENIAFQKRYDHISIKYPV